MTNSLITHFETLESYLPLPLSEPSQFLLACAFVLAVVLVRYFVMVMMFWLPFYQWRWPALQKRKIYSELPGAHEQIYEIKWSLASGFVFAVTGAFLGLMWQQGWTQIYLRFDKFGWWYLLLSPLLLIVVHDAYFYWTHRWLHRPLIYRKFHAIHHASLKPSPWASFSFHPMEALINALAIPLICLLIPLHPLVILLHLTLMTVAAITNHLGYEILPRRALEWPVLRSVISGLHHSQHHKFFRCNYGLFLNWWDLWMKTEQPTYRQDWDRLMKTGSQKSS
jgi:lathosterol oxidase